MTTAREFEFVCVSVCVCLHMCVCVFLCNGQSNCLMDNGEAYGLPPKIF